MKKLGLFMSLAVLLIFCAGCAQEGMQDGKSVEITVVTTFGSEDGNYTNFVNACRAYEAATGNMVEDQSSMSNEEWKKQVIADFEADQEPDVLFYFTGTDADRIVTSGKVVPISEIRSYQSDYASNMKDSMMPVSTADGRQYAVPVNGYWEGLYVNKKVLADCGIDIPGENYSWDEFLADCQVIKEKGYIPIACSLGEIPHYWFEFCTFNNGSLSNHVTLPAGSGDEIGKGWAAGLNDMKVLYDSGFFPADTNAITDSEANLLMTEDKAAFMIDGSWKIGWFQENAKDIGDFTVTYVPAMGERKATEIVGGLSMGYYITKKAWDDPAKREACVEFVQAMTTDEVVGTFGALSINALKNGIDPSTDTDSLMLSALAMIKGCTGITAAAQDALGPSARKALFADIPNIVTGVTTPEQVIDACLAIQLESE